MALLTSLKELKSEIEEGNRKGATCDEPQGDNDNWEVIEEDNKPIISSSVPCEALTFGVEIEFALATLQPEKADIEWDGRYAHLPNDKHGVNRWREENVRPHIAATLIHEGIRATAEDPRNTSTLWVVKKDRSIKTRDNRSTYDYYQIELVSPPMEFCEESLNNIMRVCEALTRYYRIDCNESTGLHVHVGNKSQGFEFEIVRRLMAILWTFDLQIQTIHSKERNNALYCAGFRNQSALTQMVADNFPDMPIGRVGLECLLDGTKTIEELRKLTEPTGNAATYGTRGAYFIGNVDLSGSVEVMGYMKPTVEFRQHVSTLDPERLTQWVRFCVHVVEFARAVDNETLHPFLREHIHYSPDQFPLNSALRSLGMIYQGFYFKRQIAQDEALMKAAKEDRDRRLDAGEQLDPEGMLYRIH
jgi:hypothetical protein